jgi:hypothetical protein
MNTALSFQPNRFVKSQKGSALPYLLAWMLGVPGSILFLIFFLRSVF